MNDKPPSTGGPGAPGLVARIRRAFSGEPWSRDEIQTFIESEVELDAEEKSMLTGVLEVSETAKIATRSSVFFSRRTCCDTSGRMQPGIS
jgi:hypothetical protein